MGYPKTGLLKRYILQPFETCCFFNKIRDTTIYKAILKDRYIFCNI